MNKLVINTANDELYLVLQTQDGIFHESLSSKMHHNETMLPLIDELLEKNKLDISKIDKFGVIIGPGSFTGIRVGISTIKAFRDALGVEARGINNLDLLYSLTVKEDSSIDTVAILGSKDSYFVAKLINGIVYKFERNLTLSELKKVSDNKKIGMYSFDDKVNCHVVKMDDNIIINSLDESLDHDLVPVYYQLSQAENEKLKKGNIFIERANKLDIDKISVIEREAIQTNHLSNEDITNAISSKDYVTFVSKFNDEIVGYIMLQRTDEVNIESIAVLRPYRNLSIATKLLNKAREYALEHGIKTLSLEVSKNNITAYLLYQKYGFTIRRERKAYYQDGADCLEMICSLD